MSAVAVGRVLIVAGSAVWAALVLAMAAWSTRAGGGR
jgi:HAMP domain-containing protein